jgi:hypothetical protein
MATTVAVLRAPCPLCGSPVLSVARGGRTIDEDVHPIQVGLDFGRGYVLCEACGVLADLPSTLTLN